MPFLRILAAASLLAGLAGGAQAQALQPVENGSVDLGGVAGDLHYTVHPDGLHVVATFAERGEASTPVRFEAVLAPGQTVTISTPREAGLPAEAVTIGRQADHLFVRKAALID